jgi:hypothetical protein
MRRLMILLAAVLLVAACSNSGGTRATVTTTTLKPLPAPLDDFLKGVKPQGALTFRATFHVLRKLVGNQSDITVESSAGEWTIHTGNLVITGPPAPTTADEARLSTTGVFSSFYSAGPTAALAADARRKTADAPVFSDRTVAGVDLRCAAVPQAGVITQTACLTPDGVFGYIDNAAVHVELTSYQVLTASR